MKSILLLFATIFMSIVVRAQCPFSYYVGPGSTTVSFTPDSGTVGGPFHFTWDFGDSDTSTLQYPTHTYSSPQNYLVCNYIYDTLNNLVCSACDSIYIDPCSFNVTQLGGDSMIFETQNIFGAHAEWDFGDGTGIFTGNPYVHSYTQVGNYNCICYQKDSLGNILCQETKTIPVLSLNNCSFSYGMTITPVITFTASTPAGYLVAWDFGDSTTGSGSPVQHYFNTAGVYNVIMIAYNTIGDTCSAMMSVQAGFPNSNCAFSANPDTTTPNTFNFIRTQMGFIADAIWDFGDQSGDTGLSVTHSFANAGAYFVCMTEIDTAGSISCQHCDTVYAGTAFCSFTSTPDISNPQVVYFSVNAGVNNVTWDFGDGSFDTNASTGHVYAADGMYQVCVTLHDFLTGNAVCHSCSWIQIITPSSPCYASFYASSQGLTADFIDLSAADSSISSYAWNFDDGGTSNQQHPQHIYQLPGNYNVCLSIYSTGCTDTFCNPVIIDTTTSIQPVCTAFFVIVQVAPYQLAIVNLSTGNSLNYLWDFGDGSSDTLENTVHSYSFTGSYNLCLTVSDGNGCTSTYCDTLNVDSLGNVFRYAQQGFSIVTISPGQLTSAVGEVTTIDQLMVYPNPFESEIYIVSSTNSKVESYTIYSMMGSKVSSGKIENSSASISTQNLSSGTYLLEVKLNDGERLYKGIIRK